MTKNVLNSAKKYLWLVLIQWALVSPALADIKKVDKLKAAYMYNFTKFITWPKKDDTPIVFCVHNKPELRLFLAALVASKKVAKNTLQVIDSGNGVNCDIIYLTTREGLSDAILSHRVLVTDINVLPNLEPTFRFYEENVKLRFEIHVARAEQLNIKISSKLLQVARLK